MADRSERQRFDVDTAVAELERHLVRLGTRERAAGEKRYLKSDLEFLGVTVPDIRREAKAFARAHPNLERADLLALTAALWQTRVHDLRSVAIAILELTSARLGDRDSADLIALVRDAKTWAHVDWLATKVLGSLVAREPKTKKRLAGWARDPTSGSAAPPCCVYTIPSSRAAATSSCSPNSPPPC